MARLARIQIETNLSIPFHFETKGFGAGSGLFLIVFQPAPQGGPTDSQLLGSQFQVAVVDSERPFDFRAFKLFQPGNLVSVEGGLR